MFRLRAIQIAFYTCERQYAKSDRLIQLNRNLGRRSIQRRNMHSEPRENISAEIISRKVGKITRYENIVKSQQDCREYRGLQLENGLKVLLISDPKTDLSAAALAVGVGHMSDPKDVPGLAHFCEHMLFLGTKKYPDENAYSTYLSKNGGSSNAATYPDNTRYYFDVAPDKLDGALDRFAQFFIAPLFTETATSREINAVNSEYEKNVPVDIWRIKQVSKHLANPNHPYSKFGTGNKLTLEINPKKKGISVRDELIKFHGKWYSSNMMCLAVLGKESLDELEAMIVPKFSQIKNKNVKQPTWDKDPYPKEQYATKTSIVPVKDFRALTIGFITDDLSPHYKSNPGHYVSHLIGHEGKGSILCDLRNRGWCLGLYSSHSDFFGGFGFFDISVSLTEEGLEHIDEITLLIFQYIAMLKENGPQKWIFDELYNLDELGFRFRDKEQPTSLVTNLCHSMHLYPLEEVLYAPWLNSDWQPDLINKLLDSLKPENCRLVVVSQKFAPKATEIEPYYNTKFINEKIPCDVLKKWTQCGLNENLSLPKPNPFIPTDFTIAPEDKDFSEHPRIIYDSSSMRVWHKQDNEFLKPKAYINVEISTPIAHNDPLNCNLTHMLFILFKDHLNEYLYDIELAGLKLGIVTTHSGVQMSFTGYHHKQQILLEKVLDRLFEFKIDRQRFVLIKDQLEKSLKNYFAEQPYQHSMYYLSLILVENAWSKTELLEALKLVTPERLELFMKEFLSRFHTECFIYGNITKQRALEISDIIKKKVENTNSSVLPILSRQLLQKREYKLSDGESYLFEKENEFHKSSCTQLYLQCGVTNDTSAVFVDLVVQILNEPCYNTLRTKEQLGYIVHCGSRKTTATTGIKIIVQSDRDPAYVEGRIEKFLKEMLPELENMSDQDFESHKEALITQKLEKPKKPSVMFFRYLNEISIASYHFEREESEVAILRKITKAELISYYKTFIARDSKSRHSLTIYIISKLNDEMKLPQSEGESNTKERKDEANTIDIDHVKITDLSAFKSSKELYPMARPFLNIRPKGARSKL